MGEGVPAERPVRTTETIGASCTGSLSGVCIKMKHGSRVLINSPQGTEIIINDRKRAGLVNPDTQYPLELDVFLPALNLAFEYQVAFPLVQRRKCLPSPQDIHHYRSADYAYQPLERYQERDEKKRILATEKGITLVLVPCWWDGRTERCDASYDSQ